MSLFQHLVERALELARPIEPVIDPSPLGPPVLAPSEPSFEETTIEVPAARVPAASVAAAPVAGTSVRSPIVERGRERSVTPSESAAPRVVAPREVGQPAIRPRTSEASGPVIVEREPASVIVERRIEQRVERTRERVRESTVTIEPRSADAALREPAAARSRSASVEPLSLESIEVPAIAEPVRPLAPVPERTPIASPATPARREPAGPRPSAAIEPRRASRQNPSEATPTLRIEIGRVIVRAETPAAPSRAPAASARPLTTLAEYLASRDRGSR